MKKNTTILFRKDDHSYWADDVQYISTNGLLKNFGFEFDRDYWLVRKALEKHIENFYKIFFMSGFGFTPETKPSKEDLITVFGHMLRSRNISLEEEIEKISAEWKESADKGTEFHDAREAEAYRLGFINNPFDGKDYPVRNKPEPPEGYANMSTYEFLNSLEDGVYAELLIAAFGYNTAGQADEVFIETIDGVRYVDVGDHKTNNKKPKKTTANGTCLYPIDHLSDCTYTKYQLQTNLYAHWLKMLGFVPRNIGIYHYTDYDINTKKIMTFEYLENECVMIMNAYREHIS